MNKQQPNKERTTGPTTLGTIFWTTKSEAQEQLVLDLLKKEVDGHFFIIFQKRTIRHIWLCILQLKGKKTPIMGYPLALEHYFTF